MVEHEKCGGGTVGHRGSAGLSLTVLVVVMVAQAVAPGAVGESEARNLTEKFAQAFVWHPSSTILSDPSLSGEGVDFSAAGRALAPSFSAAVAQAVTQQFPLTSVSPAFTYRYNPADESYERLTSVPGPLFSERALTLGKGQLNFGVGYSFIDFRDLNGSPLNNINSPGLVGELHQGTELVGVLPTGELLFSFPYSLSRIRTRIDLQAHIVVPTVRYGLTDRWDVSLSIPIVNTSLRVSNELRRVADLAVFLAVPPSGPGSRFVDPAGNDVDITNPPFVKSQRQKESLSRVAGSATGVGDILLRTKYLLWRNELGGAALGLTLQLPSGEIKNFHGANETHLSSFVYISQVLWKRFEPHLNLGVDWNANDVDRSSFLYAVGASLLIGAKLGVVVDFLGRSEFGRLPVRLPPSSTMTGAVLERNANTCTVQQPCFTRGTFSFPAIPLKIKRNDIADFSFGFRYALRGSGSVFFGGVVPLNADGFRPDFIPTGGIEYTF